MTDCVKQSLHVFIGCHEELYGRFQSFYGAACNLCFVKPELKLASESFPQTQVT